MQLPTGYFAAARNDGIPLHLFTMEKYNTPFAFTFKCYQFAT